jgi:hypothetical protein
VAAGWSRYCRAEPGSVLAQVRVCRDTPQEASVVDALASFGVVHADMPFDAGQHLARHPGPARGAATGRYGRAACAWSLAQVSLRPRVRLKTSRPGVESGSGQK